MNQDEQKQSAAEAAIKYIKPDAVIGVGTGSTVKYFIDALAQIKGQIDAVVSSSESSTERLKKHGFLVLDANAVNEISVYVDGADEINEHFYMIKGGGGAHTREKILASMSKKFVCIVDQSKQVELLGKDFPVAVEVIPMARGYVARQLLKMGGDPILREKFITDNGNIILDVHNLTLTDPIQLEDQINTITGVVDCGIFAKRPADIVLVGTNQGVIAKENH